MGWVGYRGQQTNKSEPCCGQLTSRGDVRLSVPCYKLVANHYGGELMPGPCAHVDQVQVTSTDKDYCEECVKMGDTWVHLRMCLTCGKVGCCNSSKNKHATRHFLESGHPLVRSIEPGEKWVWCYVDEVAPAEIA